MIFVCGIHGTGKTHYCKALSEKEQISYYSASDLILKREAQNFEAKRVDHIKENQVMLLEELQKIRLCKNDFCIGWSSVSFGFTWKHKKDSYGNR